MKETFLIPERRRWLITALIFFAIVFNYLDWQIVYTLKPMLKKEFQLAEDGYAFNAGSTVGKFIKLTDSSPINRSAP
ncbi:hypothetical protein [Pedobacter sp. ASV28]|uniref:hypothetical protein n=1 Tax=Pedobacter sp. ASV28 TaxID=2795123 RepID=UPI0018EC11B1|nr:hypothetical protein [Pedobacter sp. ASV28]